jgi:predicted nuclease of predicted toxin-antitoxin system
LQKILIDENLSPSLVADAQEKGFFCTHVNHLGKTGTKDWELKRIILNGDWTFVTNNSIDFRGPADNPGSTGEYADVRLHAGLVSIDARFGLNLNLQRQVFRLILDELAKNGDLTNQLLQVDVKKDGQVELARIALPPDESAGS